MGARFVQANGLRFAYLQTGPADGPLALLLHGFPDTAHTWRHLAPRLADLGYRVIAPWMRGYAPTAPHDGRTVDGDTLAADANALHRALDGDGDAVLVGHDWGAFAGYRAVAAAPGRWARLVTLAVPPDPALAGARRDPAQARRSWYIAALKTPGSERLLARNDLALVARLWRDWSPDLDGTEDVEHVRSSLRSPDALRSAVAYYRGLDLLRVSTPPSSLVPTRPTLYLHGSDDGCIGVRYAEAARDVLTHPASLIEIVPGAGHFLHLEHPERVNATIAGFLARDGS
ncbi:MAG: alpha/beta hydrolase [Actinobacteria bacterium]|nr:alpha/beta hydrolase [Actinomycetota bacterium]